jgi:hypothetical protein
MAAMTDGGRPIERFFYGFQPHWFSRDRLYRIYASDKMLAGAFIAGQLYDEQSAVIALQQSWLFLRTLVRRRLAKRREREALYDAVDPFSPSLLDLDERNFQLQRRDVAWTRLHTNRSWWTPINAGVVEIALLDGTKPRFVLVGDQDQGDVLRSMEGFDSAIEVTGNSNLESPPNPRKKLAAPLPEHACRIPAGADQFNQGNDFHAVSERVATSTRIDHDKSIQLQVAKGNARRGS